MKSAIDVLRSARAQPDKDSLFERIVEAGAGEPAAVITAVRIMKSVRPHLVVTFYRRSTREEGIAGMALKPADRELRNDILERAVTLAIHTKAA